MIGLVIALGVIACVCLAWALLELRDVVRQWLGWARVRREQRQAARERRLMMRYQNIGNGGRRAK